MSIMNSFVNDIFERIAAESSRLAHYNKVTYSATTSKYCDHNGNGNHFTNLDVAKINCWPDAGCVGLYDDCGHGTDFYHCNAPLSIQDSSCGSIVYQPIGK